jgi:uncharacterized membrane protein
MPTRRTQQERAKYPWWEFALWFLWLTVFYFFAGGKMVGDDKQYAIGAASFVGFFCFFVGLRIFLTRNDPAPTFTSRQRLHSSLLYIGLGLLVLAAIIADVLRGV